MTQLIIILGRRGRGKTLFMTRQAINSEREIWANYRINSPRFHKLSVSDLINLPSNIMICIDEAYAWLESRVSGSVLNRYISYLVFQIRKTNSIMFLTAKRFRTVDVRMRREVDVIIKAERTDNGIRPEDRLLDGRKDGIKVQYYYFWDFKYTFLDVDTFNEKSAFFKYDTIKKYFRYYDTKEIIDPAYKARMELELLKDNPEKLLEKCKNVADDIIDDIDEITRETVRIALMNNGYSSAYEPYVYNILKKKIKI